MHRTKRWANSIAVVVAGAMLATTAGCLPPARDETFQQRARLQQEVDTLRRRVVSLQDHIESQARTIQKLQGLDGDRAVDKLVHVASIEIERLSGGYDADRDGRDDGVVVYLRLFDRDGDTIKAAGSAGVELFDLSRPDGERLIGVASWDAAALRETWHGRFMTSHYTMRTPWRDPAIRPTDQSVTVVARFNDLLTGRTFEDQRVVEITGVATSASATRE